MKLEFYYKPECPYCQKVIRVIEKYKLEDKIDFKNIKEDEKHHQRLVEDGGQDMVPCLFIDDQPMYESSDIVQFLKKEFVQ
ncbi:MAG: glutathione S-transferase N-terminal domain-containing protein [Tissierellia bacterium]|nr:glutathione S-transferase N-terminal domain-containing protein [Tissierellia bacterium]